MSKVVRLSDETLELVEKFRQSLIRPESPTISDLAERMSIDSVIWVALNNLDKKSEE